MIMALLQDFMTHVFEARYVIELSSIALAIGIVLGKIGDEGRNTHLEPGMRETVKRRTAAVRAVLQTVLTAAVLLFFNICYFMVFRTKFRNLGGLNYSLAVLTVILLYSALVCRYRLREKMVLAVVLYSTIVTMMEWSGPLGITWIMGTKFLSEITMQLLADILMILFAVYIRKLSVVKYSLTWSEVLLNCSVSVIVAGMAMLHEILSGTWGMQVEKSIKIYIWIGFVMLYLINLLAYTFSYLMAKDRQSLLEMQIIEQKQSAELEMAHITESSLQELREIRHDIKNQYLYMKHMIEQQQYEELNDYFEKFTGKFSHQLFSYIDCGNRLISSVINLERIKAERSQIKLNVNIVVPKQLPFEESDLCSLIMNVIDNALEECERTGKEKAINVIMNTQGLNSFYFCVMNPTEKKNLPLSLPSMHTSKENKAVHGYGINIIQKIASKYDGYFNCHIEHGNFIAEVLLNMTNQGSQVSADTEK